MFKPTTLEEIEHLKSETLTLLLENIYEDKEGLLLYIYKVYLKGRYHPIGRVTLRFGESEEVRLLGNVGYHIKRRYRGKGYAKGVLVLIMALLKRYEVKAIKLTTDAMNMASQRVALGLGAIEVERIVVKQRVMTKGTGQRVDKCVKIVYKLEIK